MTPELRAMLRPLTLPEGVEAIPANEGLLATASEFRLEVLLALVAHGRDSAALLAMDQGTVVLACDSRGRIRDTLRELGDVAATAAQRLEERAPRGCWYVVVLDATRATTVLVSTPGSEIEGAAA